jgi:hypothetical protein
MIANIITPIHYTYYQEKEEPSLEEEVGIYSFERKPPKGQDDTRKRNSFIFIIIWHELAELLVMLITPPKQNTWHELVEVHDIPVLALSARLALIFGLQHVHGLKRQRASGGEDGFVQHLCLYPASSEYKY